MLCTRLAVSAFVALLATACSAPTIKADPRTGNGSTVTVDPVSVPPAKQDQRVGAVFLGSDSMHTCSGAVLDSLSGNLIITAAHCLDSAYDETFAPGYRGVGLPGDFWHIDAVYLDPRWVRHQDPAADFAIARVSHGGPATTDTLEHRVGGGFVLGAAPGPDVPITVTGYPQGDGGVQVSCSGPTSRPERGFPSVRCAGLVDGTSGSPWVSATEVRGVVGGLQGGGCSSNELSYSSPFDMQIRVLFERAEEGGPADRPNGAPDDGCGS
ncbi:trypsin [Mycobacterium sp. CBMA 234]|uniref:trypsin-like serine peptidase n=1 Tax=Mycolicibacterium sp. CBMA 234 TaxID=1918495 RepID=UPI0012DE0835|nr:trypsin-like peptidase domain-containing protein [Mycolicibacterium sp. CBMA 234]MUL67210.1 trypsin [Mycolicibacterium sp. CBMA 234]